MISSSTRMVKPWVMLMKRPWTTLWLIWKLELVTVSNLRAHIRKRLNLFPSLTSRSFPPFCSSCSSCSSWSSFGFYWKLDSKQAWRSWVYPISSALTVFIRASRLFTHHVFASRTHFNVTSLHSDAGQPVVHGLALFGESRFVTSSHVRKANTFPLLSSFFRQSLEPLNSTLHPTTSPPLLPSTSSPISPPLFKKEPPKSRLKFNLTPQSSVGLLLNPSRTRFC